MDIWDQKLVIDGGMGTELVRCGAKEVDSHRLWSTIANITEPEVVIKAHQNFISAGADIIITNSYQSNQNLIMDELKVTAKEADRYLASTVELAEKARKITNTKIIIAGSIGPLPDCPASEYNPEYLKRMTKEELMKWHEPRVKLLCESNCDILAIETMPGIKEADAILELIEKYKKDAYVSFTCRDGGTNAGEPYEKIADFLKTKSLKNIRGIGINCSDPRQVAIFGRLMADRFPNLTLITYPNSAETWSNEAGEWGEAASKWSGKPLQLHEFVDEWKKIGFRWIGGCCRIPPEQITKIREELLK